MRYFAEIVAGIVKRTVCMKDSDNTESTAALYGGEWVETVKNPVKGVFASPGCAFNSVDGIFVSEQPFPSWLLNEDTCLWEPPVPYPGGMVHWDESLLDWVA